jgi:UDPglucose 6-dehydrogenase
MAGHTGIHIVGAGVVGGATGWSLESLGYEVRYVEVNEERAHELRDQGRMVSTELRLGNEAESIVFVCVPTPSSPEGFDLSILRRALCAIGREISRSSQHTIVVVRSTVPPLTWARVIVPELESASGREIGDGYAFVFMPEFLRQVSAIEDAKSPRVTVVASRDRNAADSIAELFSPLGGLIRRFDDPTAGEVIKLASNCFNAAKISFWNEMWTLCQRVGVDQIDVGDVVAESAEGSYNSMYGIRGGYPFGGACLPKDLNGLLGFAAAEMIRLPMLEAVREVNLLTFADPELEVVPERSSLPD